jgi:Phage portal protein
MCRNGILNMEADFHMARKRKRNGQNTKSSNIVNFDSTIRQLQSQLVNPEIQQWLWRGAAGVRQRLLQINFRTLRSLSGRLPLVSGIINTRVDQVLPFCKFASDKGSKGFTFEIENQTESKRGAESDDNEIMQLTTFVEQTGFRPDDEREDDFADYVEMLVRDVYEIDQISTEIQRNRLGEPIAFWGLDGATIFRVGDEARFSKGIRYVQMIEDKIYNEYEAKDLIFDYRYKRSDINHRGYGYSPLEQAIDVVTTLLFGYNYIRDQLMRDRMPKGFISVMGDVGQPELDSIRNYWYSAMSGAGGQWAIPILPSGKDGVGMDFKTLGTNNRDMEYHKTMMFVSAVMAAVFSIDLAEMGIKTDDSQSLIGENSAPRIQNSKDRGLSSMLSFIEQHVNKVIRKITTKYRFKFVGLEREDEQKKAEVRAKEVGTSKSIDEIRKEDGLEPYNEDWSKMPLHPQAVQIFLQSKQAEQQKEAQRQFGNDGGSGNPLQGDQEMSGYSENDGNENRDDLFANNKPVKKSLDDFHRLTDEKERVVRIVIE